MNHTAKSNVTARYGIDNLTIATFPGCGPFDFPAILPEPEIPPCDWIGFNEAAGRDHPEKEGVHFFLSDYQFIRTWKDPKRYAKMLLRFRCVLSPDFSLYTDYPKAMMISNHFRKHWLAAYWQSVGVTVIPSISWAGRDTFAWCFDGEPQGAVVAVSSVGTQQGKRARRAFLDGYNAMLERLAPAAILFFGAVPEGAGGNIVRIPAYHNKFATEKGG